jgi:hypothetical protein
MHINEQSPTVLRRELSRHFRHVLVWFSGHDLSTPFENLRRRFTIAEMRQSADLFAIASDVFITPERLLATLEMRELPYTISGLGVEVLNHPDTIAPGCELCLPVRIMNGTTWILRSRHPHPVHLSYHWFDETGEVTIFDGERTTLPPIAPGRTITVNCRVRAPKRTGTFTLRVTMVQELIRWFDCLTPPVLSEVAIRVADGSQHH